MSKHDYYKYASKNKRYKREQEEKLKKLKSLKLTHKQELFCQYYLKNFNATLAYIKAYGCDYNTANVNGYKLLVNTSIKKEIDRLKNLKKNSIMLDKDDIIEKHMKIAFSDMTDFVDWGQEEINVIGQFGPIKIENPDTGEKEFLKEKINVVRFKESNLVDGGLVKEVKTGKEVSIKLEDRQKSLEWLSKYFLMNPLDKHKIDFDKFKFEHDKQVHEDKMAMEEKKITQQYSKDINIDDTDIDVGKINNSYIPYMEDETRNQIFFGGSSSGKSYSIAQRTIKDIWRGQRNYLICRQVASTIKKSVFNEITKAILNSNKSKHFTINRSEMVITCTKNNKQILFCGLDDSEKIKSITPIDGVITDVIVEEATETERKSIKQLQKRLRGKSEVKKRLTLLFNPILQSHWIYKEYFTKWNDDENFYRDEDLLILRTTYKDNEFLTDDDIKALENEPDKYYYDVYTLGKWGILGAVIFKNWEMADLTELKKSADNYKCGLDFGFAKDPNGFIVTHYDKKRETIYILDEIYINEIDNEQLAHLIKKKIDNKVVVCDSQEPKSIKELNKYKVHAIGAKKGPDSVDFGIKFLQKQKIIIDYKCVNFKNEISQYKWKEDKQGNVLPIPIDRFNHLLDGLRYGYEDEMINKKKWGLRDEDGNLI